MSARCDESADQQLCLGKKGGKDACYTKYLAVKQEKWQDSIWLYSFHSFIASKWTSQLGFSFMGSDNVLYLSL